MTTPSQTVQTAQLLLAERERVGLAKYGTTVDRTDLSPVEWLQHAIEETLDQALYLIRLRETIAELQSDAAAMSAGQCVHPLGIVAGAHGNALCPLNGKPQGTVEDWSKLAEQPPNCPCGDRLVSQCPGEWEPGCDLGSNEAHAKPAPPEASASLAAAIDPDRAAYLARWKDAPEWAEWLAEDDDGGCYWFQAEPSLIRPSGWLPKLGRNSSCQYAGENMLGYVKCERRPKP